MVIELYNLLLFVVIVNSKLAINHLQLCTVCYSWEFRVIWFWYDCTSQQHGDWQVAYFNIHLPNITLMPSSKTGHWLSNVGNVLPDDVADDGDYDDRAPASGIAIFLSNFNGSMCIFEVILSRPQFCENI